MTIQNETTGDVQEIGAGTNNMISKGATTNPLKAQPEIDNGGLAGSVTSGSFASVWGPGMNSVLFKNKEVTLAEWDFASESVRNTAIDNLLTALGDGLLAVSVNTTTGAVTDLATP